MTQFSMSFSPEALSAIAQLSGFPTLLSSEVQKAMKEGGDLLVPAIQGAMNWKNPSGDLEDSIHVITDSPYELQIGSDLPYARRRNYGFSGMTDSMGRYYANDPGAFFMEDGMNSQKEAVLQLVYTAADHALQRLGGA